jgi:hypothetical protein
MRTRGSGAAGFAAALLIWLGFPGYAAAGPPSNSQSHVEAAVENIAALERPGKDGLATVSDGNKYVQCRRMPDHALRCEAGGALMQPSLDHVLSSEKIARLAALGWRLDASFGNYVQSFPADLPASQVAEKILQALSDGYNADLANLEIRTDWIVSQPCPPRNGPSQNLAGMIDEAPSMAKTGIQACAYTPAPSSTISSAADLIRTYGARTTGEIQRLRVNIDRDIFVVFETDIGFVQCAPRTSSGAIYCEAQSADSWPALSSVLTPERVTRLQTAGYSDPGRAPNYSKTYALDQFDDAAIARELLTILYDVYGYVGAPKLKIDTEKGN